jgi:hypothetical protein
VAIVAVSLLIMVELPRVDICVAILAILRCALEHCRAAAYRDQVARTAGGRAVGANQWKVGFRVIKTFRIDPGPDVMASLAA